MVTLRAKGATCRTIALRLGISERTVQRWLRTGHFPERRRRSERPGQLGRYTAYLQARWAEGGHHATRLHQELQARGFHGSYGSVAAWVAAWREQHYRHRGQIRTRQPPHPAADGLATPRRGCWLLLRPEGDLTHAEREFRSHLYTACPQVATAQELVKEFARVFRERDVDGLYVWLRQAEASGITELQALVRSVWIDRPAVEAAVRMEWSNGQVEGSVNKLNGVSSDGLGQRTANACSTIARISGGRLGRGLGRRSARRDPVGPVPASQRRSVSSCIRAAAAPVLPASQDRRCLRA
jgi:transposase